MRVWKECLRLMKEQKGAYMVLVALVLPLLFLFAGLAVDLGRGFSHKAKLQNAADAAVMAAAHVYFPNESGTDVHQWADRYMKANMGDTSYQIDKITVRKLKDAGGDDSVLLSLYASENVPVTFMAIMNTAPMSVGVVATAKVTPQVEAFDPGVWEYAMISSYNPADPTFWEKLWQWIFPSLKNAAPFVFVNDKHKIYGKVHTNGSIGMNGIHSGYVEKGKFTTSLSSDSSLWKNNSAWSDDYRLQYFDKSGVIGDVEWSSSIKTNKIDISLSETSSYTSGLYKYVEKQKKKYGSSYNNGETYIYIKKSYSDSYSSSNGFESWSNPNCSLIIADGDVKVYDKQYSSTADHLTIISLHGNVTLDVNEPVKALIYAPRGTVYLNVPARDEKDGYSFEGSVVGSRIELTGKNTSDTKYVTYNWNDFDFGEAEGDSNGSAILYKDSDDNYGTETAI